MNGHVVHVRFGGHFFDADQFDNALAAFLDAPMKQLVAYHEVLHWFVAILIRQIERMLASHFDRSELAFDHQSVILMAMELHGVHER